MRTGRYLLSSAIEIIIASSQSIRSRKSSNLDDPDLDLASFSFGYKCNDVLPLVLSFLTLFQKKVFFLLASPADGLCKSPILYQSPYVTSSRFMIDISNVS